MKNKLNRLENKFCARKICRASLFAGFFEIKNFIIAFYLCLNEHISISNFGRGFKFRDERLCRISSKISSASRNFTWRIIPQDAFEFVPTFVCYWNYYVG